LFSIVLNVGATQRDTLIAELWEAGTAGITESDDWVQAFFEEGTDPATLREQFRDYSPEIETVELRDWAAESRDQWQPFPVGERFYLVPEWRNDPAPCGRMRLRIYPGMACGTGTHPATQLCLRAMEQHIKEGMSLLDIGTGSGILAEAARLLGADPVFACDIDAEAAATARANLRKSIFNVPVFAGSVRSVRSGAIHTIVANLNLAELQAITTDVRRVLRDDGLLIVAGFREDEAERAAAVLGRDLRARYELDNWTCLVLGDVSPR
jgi:ribosomal protein L11 methyltransferase